ncbi:hypothetical protein PFICI_13057 [Pestalotiopsis fici W106-1]|uniref:Uncharacterized protein n=1 Tax=Pestalotiopsis fici (strain W106-1 / CGMCC3.15140) TaxID=1229662 RepID=W3WL15_PESFW|nr:uncharacterized protein PFICI_13057 [Pestalotiopsis fici W106-1]ETS74573.1 hypothetical protein PFICI_13057 [Pestalotiopsis fici W106-1]
MARLDTLPVELLHDIAGFVSSNAVMLDAKGETGEKSRWAESDLAALSCTNRQFHQIFTPYLYQWDQEYGSYAMSWAIQTSSYETLEKTLTLGYHLDSIITLAKRWRNYKENQRHRPIEIAILFEEHRLLKWLLEHGASADPGPVKDVQLEDGSVHRMAQGRSSSPLYRALVQLSDDNAAVILLDAGARTRFGRDDTFFYSCTALHLAATRGLAKTMERLLLPKDTLDINEKDWHGHTALHLAVLEQDHRMAIIEKLLRHGANPHTSNNENTTAIESAVSTGHLENVLALIQAMANTSPQDASEVWTPPCCAQNPNGSARTPPRPI